MDNSDLEINTVDDKDKVVTVAASSHFRRGKLVNVRSFTRKKKRPNSGIRSDFRFIPGYRKGSLTVKSVMARVGKIRTVVVACDCGNVCEMKTNRLNQVMTCGRINHLSASEDVAFNHLFKAHELGAAKRGLEFKLDKAAFKALTARDCYYCGRPPHQYVKIKQVSRSCDLAYSGIDRLDSNIGYVESNCVPACGTCNKAKSTKSHAEFCAWISLVHSHLVKTGKIQ